MNAKKSAKKAKRVAAGKKVVVIPWDTRTPKATATRNAIRRAKQAYKIAQSNPITGIRGKGDYFTDIKDYVTGRDEGQSDSRANQFIQSGARGIANAVGLGAFGDVAASAGSWLSRALGLGDYSIRRNSLMPGGGGNVASQPAVGRPPSFGTIGVGSDIIFSHSDYVADISSSVEFNKTEYLINAGNNTLFPWMSKIAALYEECEFMGLLFAYRPTSATAVGTTSSGMGVVGIATDYDCYDAGFNTKREVETAEYASVGRPFDTFLHPIECDPKRNVLARNYVVPGLNSIEDAPGDARMSILGRTTVMTQGQQTTGDIIGELWVTYHVRLSRPILEESSTNFIFTQHAHGTLAAAGTSPVITANISKGGVPFDVSIVGSGNTLRFQMANTTNGYGGNYILRLVTSPGTATSTTYIAPNNPTPGYSGGCHAVSELYGTQPSYIACASHSVDGYSGQDQSCVSIIVNFSGTGTISVPMIGCDAIMSWDFAVTPYNDLIQVTNISQKEIQHRTEELASKLEELSSKYEKLLEEKEKYIRIDTHEYAVPPSLPSKSSSRK